MSYELNTSLSGPITVSAADQRLQHVADAEPTRYAIDGVYFNCRMAVATNGRSMVARLKTSAVENAVVAFGKPSQAKSTELTYYPVADGRLVTGDGRHSASLQEGRFPRWEDFLPAKQPSARITLDARLLWEMAQAMTPSGETHVVTIDIIDRKTVMVITSTHDQDVVGVLMPCYGDDDSERPTGIATFQRLINPAYKPEPLAEVVPIQEAEAQPEPVVEPIQEPTTEPKTDRRVKHDVDWSSVADRYRTGETFSAIAKSLGVPNSTVYGRLCTMGLITPKPRKARSGGVVNVPAETVEVATETQPAELDFSSVSFVA